MSAGTVHTCALLADSSIACWGSNTNGQLGTGDTTDRYCPTGVVGLGQGTCCVGLISSRLAAFRAVSACPSNVCLGLDDCISPGHCFLMMIAYQHAIRMLKTVTCSTAMTFISNRQRPSPLPLDGVTRAHCSQAAVFPAGDTTATGRSVLATLTHMC